MEGGAPAATGVTFGEPAACPAPAAPAWSLAWGGEAMGASPAKDEAILEPGALAVVGGELLTTASDGRALAATWATEAEATPNPWNPIIAGFSLADLEPDGAADLLLSGPSPGLVRDAAQPAATEVPLLFEPLDDGFIRDMVPADFTGDGLPDLFVQFTADGASAPDLRPVLAINHGGGSFVSTLPVVEGDELGGAASDATALDGDGDGDADVLVCHADGTSAALQLLLNDGGLFRPAPATTLPTAGVCRSVALGAPTAAGEPTVVAALTDRVERWTRSGAGWTLDAGLTLPAPAEGARYGDAVPADLDNDGDEDLLVAETAPFVVDAPGRPLWVVWNDGGTPRPEVLVDAAFVRGVVLRDTNGDGLLDVFVGDAEATPRVLLSQGCSAGAWMDVAAPLGTEVRVEVGGAVVARAVVTTESGAGSAGEPVAHLGLGDAASVDKLVLVAPGGATAAVEGPLATRRTVRWSP